jgi:hypothetical protein
MKDRQAPVRVFMHAHRGTHEMRPERARRDLQAQASPLDGIIVPHPALLLDAQNVLHSAAAIADEGATGLGRGDREGGIVGRPIALGEPAIGRCDRRDAGQRQLLRRPVLQGAEGALAAAARRGRIGRDVADAELRQGAPDLRLPLLDTASPALGVWK